MPGAARASPDWRWRSYICECPLGGRFDVSGQSCFATNSFWDSPLCRSGERTTTKGGHADAIPIHPELVPFLQRALETASG
jgi:hypothetical protein